MGSCFYIKRQKSFFHDSFSRSFTWGYRGLEGVRRGLRGLNWVTTGYKGLQGLTVKVDYYYYI